MQATEIDEAAPPVPGRSVRRLAFWAAALIVVGLDQLTKGIIRGTLDRGETWPDWGLPIQLKHIQNSGAAFGILQDQTVFLIVMACIGLGAIYLYYRNPPFDHWLSAVAIGMMLGGALGNLIDRVRMGHVTDFIKPDHYPAFNVADSSIFLGVSTLIIGYLWAEQQRTAPTNENAPADG